MIIIAKIHISSFESFAKPKHHKMTKCSNLQANYLIQLILNK